MGTNVDPPTDVAFTQVNLNVTGLSKLSTIFDSYCEFIRNFATQ